MEIIKTTTMEIRIDIKRTCNARGTIGWLVANIGSIEIVPIKSGKLRGKQSAWLLDRAGQTITLLSVRGLKAKGHDGLGNEIVHAANGGQLKANFDLCAHLTFTDTAWRLIQKIQTLAADEMNLSETNHCEVNVSAT